MTIVRDGLVQYEIMSKEEADKFMIRLAKMNVYAFKYRYDERRKATVVHSAMRYSITLPALINMLRCVRHQCSEGDTETKHKTSWDMLQNVIGRLCEQFFHESMTLDSSLTINSSLPWGIYDKDDLASHNDVIGKIKAATIGS
jgi:hypothetical protein